jgi:redox-sensitive bicupin YhaK (pirin superfamily)
MLKEASYDDFKSEDMAYSEESGISFKHYAGAGGPVMMDSEGVEVYEMNFSAANHNIVLDADKIYSYYVLGGRATVNNVKVNEHDFIVVENENEIEIEIEVSEGAKLFAIVVPQELTYKTYMELVNN